jgi:hypothetical protein
MAIRLIFGLLRRLLSVLYGEINAKELSCKRRVFNGLQSAILQ